MLGVGLYFGALALVAYNEQSTVCVTRALDVASNTYNPVSCEPEAAEAVARPGADPIYFHCPLAPESLPQWTPGKFAGFEWLDGAFSVKAVKFRQEVSMFQCTEEKHTEKERSKDGKKQRVIESWTYKMKWSPHWIDSSKFKAWDNRGAREALKRGCGHNFQSNPGLTISSQDLAARSFQAGAYDVSRHLSKVRAEKNVLLKSGYYRPPKGKSEVQIEGDTVHTCTPGNPDLGCLRISFKQSTAHSVSLLAARGSRSGSTRPWKAPASWMCSRGSGSSLVDLFAENGVSADDLIDMALDSNTVSTWLLRVVGVALAVFGVYLFFQPIQFIANVIDQFFKWFSSIPVLGWLVSFLGDFVSGAVGCVIVLVSLGIGVPSALTVLSITWCVMRPLLGVPMLIGCVVALAYTVKAMFRYAKEGQALRAKTA